MHQPVGSAQWRSQNDPELVQKWGSRRLSDCTGEVPEIFRSGGAVPKGRSCLIAEAERTAGHGEGKSCSSVCFQLCSLFLSCGPALAHWINRLSRQKSTQRIKEVCASRRDLNACSKGWEWGRGGDTGGAAVPSVCVREGPVAGTKPRNQFPGRADEKPREHTPSLRPEMWGSGWEHEGST